MDSRINKINTIIRKYFSSVLNPEGRVPSSRYYVNNNPDTTWGLYFLYKLRHDFDLKTNAEVALLPAVAEIAFGECRFGFDNSDDMKVERLKKYITLLKEDAPFLETFKKGGVTFEQLEERYGATLDSKARADQEKMDKTEYTRNANYTIIPISTMEEAYEYGKDSGVDGEELLCFTTHESSWASFTNNGKNKSYCILRNDYKNVPCEKGDGYPKDNYGLSMIFVFVSPWGELTNSNVRWNHGYRDFSDVDNMFSKSEISDIIGQRFDEAFNCEDGVRRLEQEVLQKGERHGVVVSYDYRGYLMDSNGRLKRNEYGDLFVFDKFYGFKEGFAKVKLNGQYNFIDKEGDYLSEQWFDEAYSFSEGFAWVKLNHKWNFIDTEGNLLSEQGFDGVCDFREGFASVRLNGKWNFIDKEGNYLCEQWFEGIGDFREGFARVKLDGKWNYIDRDCNYIGEQWFDDVDDFSEGLARVILDNKWNFIDRDFNLLNKQGFDDVGDFREGFACVKLDGKWNYIDTEGNYIGEQWFDFVCGFNDGFGKVELNHKWNYIDREGDYIGEQWFDWTYNFSEGFACVKLDSKWNFINGDGNLLSEQWFDDVGDFSEGFALVELNGMRNYIDKKGNLLSKQWFDYVLEFHEGFAEVKLNGSWYYMDKEGCLSLKEKLDNACD